MVASREAGRELLSKPRTRDSCRVGRLELLVTFS